MLKYRFHLIINLVSVIIAAAKLVEATDELKTIKTEDGYVRGRKMVSLFDEKPYYSFRGIPYAKPPVNDLRFKAPQKPDSWDDIKDVFEYGNQCVQTDYMTKQTSGHEDCLFLNVFVPVSSSNEKISVMVFIHGGGYHMGSSNIYGPEILVNNDVILVTLNYRLGPLGFLSLDTPEYSGNMGLKDQLLAIKWVNKNIENFGGNVYSITLFGESAGSSSTHFHVLSPASQGLFQRAILQSGSVLNPWAFFYKNNQLETLYERATKSVNAVDKAKEIENKLFTLDAQTLTKDLYIDMYTFGLSKKEVDVIWAPVAEIPNAIDPFLTKYPQQYLLERTDDIDTLFGVTSAEMYLIIAPEIMHPELLRTFNEKFEYELPKMNFKQDYSSKDKKLIAQDIRNFYFGEGVPINKETLIQYNNLMSDTWFVYGVDESVKLQTKRSTGRTFYYRFSVDTELNIAKKLCGATKIGLPGVSHADDIFYLFRLTDPFLTFPYESLKTDSIEMKAIKEVTKIWTNFAKYATPTTDSDPIQFKPVEKNEAIFYDITNNGLVAGVNPFGDRMKFWNDLYQKYDQLLKKNVNIKNEL